MDRGPRISAGDRCALALRPLRFPTTARAAPCHATAQPPALGYLRRRNLPHRLRILPSSLLPPSIPSVPPLLSPFHSLTSVTTLALHHAAPFIPRFLSSRRPCSRSHALHVSARFLTAPSLNIPTSSGAQECPRELFPRSLAPALTRHILKQATSTISDVLKSALVRMPGGSQVPMPLADAPIAPLASHPTVAPSSRNSPLPPLPLCTRAVHGHNSEEPSMATVARARSGHGVSSLRAAMKPIGHAETKCAVKSRDGHRASTPRCVSCERGYAPNVKSQLAIPSPSGPHISTSVFP